MPESDGRKVKDMLHALRGEQYRHRLNVDAQQSRVRGAVRTTAPGLPLGLVPPLASSSETPSPTKTWSGPTPPISWQKRQDAQRTVENASTRARMLSVILPGLPDNIPPLTLLCLRRVVDLYESKEDFEEMLSYIPPHLRCQMMRDTAVHAPLSNAKLHALIMPDCHHVDGELFVVGLTQSLPGDFFQRPERKLREAIEWDDDDDDEIDEWLPKPFHTLVVASTMLQRFTFLNLPRTLTHLGLVNLSTALPLHRLPATCPSLIVLDLSHNVWLMEGHKDVKTMLDRVPWLRWKSLRVLGMRECRLDESLVRKINEDRWDDVQIIQ